MALHQKALQVGHYFLSLIHKGIASQLLNSPLFEVDILLLAKSREMIVTNSAILINTVDIEYGCDVSLLYSF